MHTHSDTPERKHLPFFLRVNLYNKKTRLAFRLNWQKGVSAEGKSEGYVFHLDSAVAWIKLQSLPNTMAAGCNQTGNSSSPWQTLPAGQPRAIIPLARRVEGWPRHGLSVISEEQVPGAVLSISLQACFKQTSSKDIAIRAWGPQSPHPQGTTLLTPVSADLQGEVDVRKGTLNICPLVLLMLLLQCGAIIVMRVFLVISNEFHLLSEK